MIPDVLEHRLAEHCAPTLLGAKAASLLSLSREEFPELPEALRLLQPDTVPHRPSFPDSARNFSEIFNLGISPRSAAQPAEYRRCQGAAAALRLS